MLTITRAHRALVSCAVAAALVAPLAAAAQPAPARTLVRGSITSLSSDGVLTVQTASGPVAVTLTPTATVRITQKASLAELKPGEYVGAGTVPGANGALRATFVQIFPAAQRGIAEGHSPWDQTPGSMMTNATIQDVQDAKVTGVTNRTMTLTYKGGQQKVVVPEDAPVVTFAPGDRSMLTPGTRVFIVARPDATGKLSATGVAIGKNGFNPPM